MKALAIAGAFAGLLISCVVQAGGAPRVVESFNVGPAVYVRALAVEPARGALWVGTSAGLSEVDLATGKLRATFARGQGLASEQIYALAIDAQGHKWIGTGSGGASRYRDGVWKTYFPMHGLADYRVFSFAADPRGAMWFGTLAGASRLDARSGTFTTYAKQLVNRWVYGIAVDQKGRIWFATEGGVSMYDGKAWRAWTAVDGVGVQNEARGNYVLAVIAARDGSVWAGTSGGGVARFDGNRWASLMTKDGLAGDVVYSIAEDADGTLWFGTDAGLSAYDGGRFTNLGPKQGLEGHIFAISAAPNGEIWAGSRGSVARIARR